MPSSKSVKIALIYYFCREKGAKLCQDMPNKRAENKLEKNGKVRNISTFKEFWQVIKILFVCHYGSFDRMAAKAVKKVKNAAQRCT